jgi:hypothetical protein
LQNRLIQTSQTGGQWYSDTFTFSIPWSAHIKILIKIKIRENTLAYRGSIICCSMPNFRWLGADVPCCEGQSTPTSASHGTKFIKLFYLPLTPD